MAISASMGVCVYAAATPRRSAWPTLFKGSAAGHGSCSIDLAHTAAAVQSDLNLSEQLLGEGGIVAIDDILNSRAIPGAKEPVSYLPVPQWPRAGAGGVFRYRMARVAARGFAGGIGRPSTGGSRTTGDCIGGEYVSRDGQKRALLGGTIFVRRGRC